MAKRWRPIDGSQEATEGVAASDAFYAVTSTTPATADDVSLTFVLRLAVVCAGVAIVAMLLVIPVISCSSCPHQSNDPEKQDDTVLRGCSRLLDVIESRRHLERPTEKRNRVNVAGVGDSCFTDNGISTHDVFLIG